MLLLRPKLKAWRIAKFNLKADTRKKPRRPSNIPCRLKSYARRWWSWDSNRQSQQNWVKRYHRSRWNASKRTWPLLFSPRGYRQSRASLSQSSTGTSTSASWDRKCGGDLRVSVANWQSSTRFKVSEERVVLES